MFLALDVAFPSFAGAEVARHPLFVPGQVLHAFAAAAAVGGTFAIVAPHQRGGWKAAMVASIAVGNFLMYFADAMIALVVFPILAAHAPDLLLSDGPMFSGPALAFYITAAAWNMVGIVLLGLVAWRRSPGSRAPALLFLLGGVMFNLPPLPSLHYVLVVGGVVWGLGAVWLAKLPGPATHPY